MSFAPNPARRIVCLVMLLAVAVLLLPGPVLAYNGATCAAKWPQDRLAVSPNLKTRHFVLEPLDEVQQLPPFLEPGARRVFHRAFSLSLDAAEPIGIYRTSARRICIVARDSGIARPIRVPVFFIGRDGQPAPELKEDAERTAFARTSSLTDVEDFTDVRFHLRKGGWSFPYIKPFFVCGLPGLMLCEGRLPHRFGAACAVVARLGVKGRDVAAGSLGHRRTIAQGQAWATGRSGAFPQGIGQEAGHRAASCPFWNWRGESSRAAAKQDCPPAPPAAPAVAASKPAEETVPAVQPRQKPAVEPPVASAPAQKPVSEPPVASAPAQRPVSEPPVAAVPAPKPAGQPRRAAAKAGERAASSRRAGTKDSG